MVKFLQTIVLLFFSTHAIYAQETGTIEGKIYSNDGEPISGMSIKFDNKHNETKTNTNGEFIVSDFPIGNHTITLEAIGIKKQSKVVLVEANKTSYVIFNLEENSDLLNEIVITVNNSPNNKKETILSGLDIKAIDIPQSIQIIDHKTIAEQQSIKLSDVVKNLNGVYVGSTRGAATESFGSRGYDMSSNNMFKNGFRYNNGSIPEIATLEKVEFLKGSSALLFGNVAPGGVLNLVTKKPTFEKGGEVQMQFGSYAFYKPTIDFHGPLNKNIAYRFIGTYENSESFRDVVKRERYYINPSLLFKITSKTNIVLQADYLHDNWTPDFGTAIIGKEIADLPRNTYLGAIWSNGQTRQASLSALIRHNFNENWKLNFNSSFQNYERNSKGTERIQPDAEGNWLRPLGQNKNIEQLVSEQINIQGKFNTGKVKHQLFGGVDFNQSFADANTFVFDPKTYGGGNIFDFEHFDQGGAIPEAVNTKLASTKTTQFGAYFQDLISVTEQFKILVGLRWSWQESQVTTKDLTKDPIEIKKDGMLINKALSPKAGLVYKPTKDLALFASYSNSFSPNSGTTVDLKPIKPSIIDQYEVGIKNDFVNGKLSTNITYYQIKNNNLAQTAELKADGSPNTDSTLKILNGATESKGIEIDITAKPIEGLNIKAGYSYNDMRYTKTSGLKGSFIQGDRLVRTPANTANLSFFYTFQEGVFKDFSIGAIANYVGKRVGGWNNTVDLDKPNGINDREIPLNAYTLIDATIGYKWKQISILFKVSNISNVLNYDVHENYSVNPLAPRQYMTSLKYKF